MKRQLFLGSVLVLALFGPRSASADWKRILTYVQPEVEVLEQDEERLVLKHPRFETQVVLTKSPSDSSHIFGDMQRQRNGNPYRVWLAGQLLLEDPSLPRTTWGSFFRAEFLRIVRVPDPPTAR